jgi:hypothetical protein
MGWDGHVAASNRGFFYNLLHVNIAMTAILAPGPPPRPRHPDEVWRWAATAKPVSYAQEHSPRLPASWALWAFFRYPIEPIAKLGWRGELLGFEG